MTHQPTRPLGVEDDARLAALAAFGILDTPPERGFDDIVNLARRLCDVPVALVSLVDRDRQWFKARAGFPPCETDLDSSVCKFVLDEPGVLQIPDLTADPRTLGNPLVTDEPHLRFYAGAPLRTPEGQALGSLCVIDHVARPGGLTPTQVEDLEALARQVMDQLVLRRALAERDEAMADQRRFLAQRATLIETQGAVAAAEGDLDAVLSTLVEGALRAVVSADGAAIELREGDELVYRSVAGTLAGHLGTRLPVDGSLAGACLTSGEPILCPDVLRDPRVRADAVATLRLRSCILLPVTKGYEVAGVLKLQSARPGAFSERDLYAALTFAGSVSAGLAQAGEADARRVASESERLLGLERGLLRAVLQQAPVGISIAHAGGGALLNDRMVEMLGHGVGGADDARYAGYGGVHADGRPYAVSDYPTVRALRQGETVDGETLRYRSARTGEVRQWRAHSTPVFGPGGEAIAAVSVFIDVEDQVRAANAMRESEASYRNLVDLSPAIIWYGRPDGSLTFASHQLYDFTGLTPEELPPQEWPRVIHPADLPRVVESWDRARAEQTLYDTEFRIRDATGRYRWFSSQAAPVRDTEGVVTGWLGHNTNIDARKSAEAEANKLAAVVGQSRDFVGIARPDGSVDYVNEAGRRLVGLPDLQAARARKIVDFFVPGERDRILGEVLPAVERDGYWEGETCFTRFDGGPPVPVLYNIFPVRDQAGILLGYATVTRDLTERKAAEAALLKLAAVAEQSSDFIGIADAEGRVDYVNPAGRRLVGLADEAAARAARVTDFFLPADLPFVEAEIVPRVMAGDAWVGDFRFRNFTTGDAVPVHYNQFSLRGPDGAFAGYATVSRDIAERKRAEALQDLLNHELSHRMKNLLAMVQAIAASTLRGATDVAEAREVLASRLVALGKAHDVLLGGAAERADLASVVREGVGVQEEAGRRVSFDGPDTEIGGKAALSLALTLHELTTNAVKYGALSVPEGRVAVLATIEDGCLRISWRESGGPPVRPPSRKGFGSRLIERGLSAQVGATIRLDYPPEGVTCVIEATVADFQAMS